MSLDGRPKVTIIDDYAYVRGENSWAVRELLEAENLQVVELGEDQLDDQFWPEGFPVLPDVTYARDENGDWEVIDVSNPVEPKSLGSYGALGVLRGSEAVSVGDFAYRKEANSLCVYDIRDPARPVHFATYDSSHFRNEFFSSGVGLPASDSFDYVDDGDGGWLIVDVSDPAVPTHVGPYELVVGTMNTWPRVVVVGRLAIGDNRIVSLSDPHHPQDVATLSGAARSSFFSAGGGGFWRDSLNEMNKLELIEIPPFIHSLSASVEGISLSWESFGKAVQLQRSTSLLNPDWQDLIGSESVNEITLPRWSGSEFFRLVRP